MVSRGEELRQQAQRKKTIALVILLCCAGFVWSRTLFANDDGNRAAVVASVAPSTAPVTRPTVHPATAGSLKPLRQQLCCYLSDGHCPQT